jgi:hypothetical protein
MQRNNHIHLLEDTVLAQLYQIPIEVFLSQLKS